MSSFYLVVRKLHVEGANAVNGYTCGPANITGAYGFADYLARGVSKELKISSVALVCNSYQMITASKKTGRVFFSQERFKSYKSDRSNVTAGIIETGKINETVSLIAAISGINDFSDESLALLADKFTVVLSGARFCGGKIVWDRYRPKAEIHREDELFSHLNLFLPGAVLLDRSDLLSDVNGVERLNKFLDGNVIKFQAQRIGETDAAKWQIVNRRKGFIVPVMSGYKAIEEMVPAGALKRVRDNSVNTVFVEPVHTLAQWCQSFTKETFSKAFWAPESKFPFYIFKGSENITSEDEELII